MTDQNIRIAHALRDLREAGGQTVFGVKRARDIGPILVATGLADRILPHGDEQHLTMPHPQQSCSDPDCNDTPLCPFLDANHQAIEPCLREYRLTERGWITREASQ